MSYIKLMFYKSRWYSPELGRFVQPDPIIAEPGSSQGYNRYAYVGNNPINFIDPSGHAKDCQKDFCTDKELIAYADQFNITFEGNWDNQHMLAAILAAVSVGSRFMQIHKGEAGFSSFYEAFKTIYGYINFIWKDSVCGSQGGCTHTDDPHFIGFNSMSGDKSNKIDEMQINVVHELGHAFDFLFGKTHGDKGINYTMTLDLILNRDKYLQSNPTGDEKLWQQHPFTSEDEYYASDAPGETFADLFVAWVFNAWNTAKINQAYVNSAKAWADSNMGQVP